jgi:ribosomal protein L37E
MQLTWLMGSGSEIHGQEPEARSDDPAGIAAELASQAAGQAETGKQCASCGVAGTVLAWRPSERASSPLTEAKWWPTRRVYEAKLTCPRCGSASYGWLIAAEPQDLTGEFLIAAPAELSA